MKIALAQIDTTIGAVEENARRVVEMARRAEGMGADLVAFPEMTLPGYPPRDLLERRSFIERNVASLEGIAREATRTAIVVGYAAPSERRDGKPVQNAAAVLQDGKVVGVARKGLLPTYDVFDERRHFEPADRFQPIPCHGRRIGLCVCEDIWNYEAGDRRREYRCDPVEALVDSGADLILNLSASPYSIGRPREREEVGRSVARRYRLPVALVNLVGGNDDIIFDGTSYLLGPDAEPIVRAASFAEDLLVADLDGPRGEVREPPEGEDEIIEALALGLADYARKCRFETAILGLSGGIDSAVVCILAARALGPSRVTAISMPGPYTSAGSRQDAAALARAAGVEFAEIPIGRIFDAFREGLRADFAGEPHDLAEENIQARIRGNILMALSNRFGHLVLSTGNKSEMAVGYCTLYGDLSGGLAVISDVPKTTVYRLARRLNRDREVIPERIIRRAPSAELRPDQTDQDSLPPYEVLDPILKAYIEEGLDPGEIASRGHDPSVVREVIARVDRNEYKRRQSPPGLRVTMKAFGIGRRLPIARGCGLAGKE